MDKADIFSRPTRELVLGCAYHTGPDRPVGYIISG
jgi:hypothetical protein